MTTYIEALNKYNVNDTDDLSVFLGGGITGCPDWQAEMRSKLEGLPITILNPRRANFPIEDPSAGKEQITWEYDQLARATAILFWFPCETLCPITLYELGKWSHSHKPLFVGVHPDYKRRFDVEMQTSLARTDVKVCYSLDELASQVRAFATR